MDAFGKQSQVLICQKKLQTEILASEEGFAVCLFWG